MLNTNEINPINLAFIGDGVYDIYIRTRLISKSPKMKIKDLSKLKSEFVNAKSQAEIMREIKGKLLENELDVFKRGRNAKSKSAPKGKSVSDYRNATGFETLIGYLYLTEKKDRLDEIMNLAYEFISLKLMEKTNEEKE